MIVFNIDSENMVSLIVKVFIVNKLCANVLCTTVKTKRSTLKQIKLICSTYELLFGECVHLLLELLWQDLGQVG